MTYLNLGCGAHFHADWTNIDLVPCSPLVLAHDVRKGIPFPNEYFDAVYHSHLLEHFPKDSALPFLQECHRVLKPGGTLRVVVPDLESIVRNYLSMLEQAEAGAPEAAAKHDWMLLELYDQAVRTASGGEMARVLCGPSIRQNRFVLERMGAEADPNIQNTKHTSSTDRTRVSVRQRLTQLIPSRLETARRCVRIIAGGQGEKAFMDGLFRQAGEVHLWMYDRLSLQCLLENAGFVNIRRCRADESHIPAFSCYQLDVEGGITRKPDSLFMEGMKGGR